MMNIDLQNLSFKPNGKSVFEGLTFSFKAGANYLISGASGCGKSSLLNIVSGMISGDLGEVLINGELIKNFCEHRKKCQYLRQTPYMYPSSVRENLLLGLRYHKEILPSDEELLAKASKLFPEGLDLDQDADQLSGGQQQRLALLRAILLKPTALLCDELTAGLDEESRKLCENFLEYDCKTITLLFVSHIAESFAGSTNFTRLHMTKNALEVL